MNDQPTDPSRRTSPRSRAIYFWIAIGVFVGVLAVAQVVDPSDPPPVKAAETPLVDSGTP